MKTLIFLIAALCIASTSFAEVIVVTNYGPNSGSHVRNHHQERKHIRIHEQRMMREHRMHPSNRHVIMELQ